MNKTYKLLPLFLGLISLQVYSAGCAGSDGNCARPDSYILTMTKLELCTGVTNTGPYDVTCNGATTVGTGSLVFDVTSVTAGQAIATFASTKGLPIGTTFTHIKPTMLREIKLKGSVEVSGSGFSTFTCHTDSTATLNGGNKYERLIAGESEQSSLLLASGTPTLGTYYLVTDSGSQTRDGVSYVSQNAANLIKMCTNKACTSTYDWTNYNKDVPTSDSRFGISIEDVTSADDDFSMLFALQAPYTVSEVAPKINLAFGTSMSLSADTSNGSTCSISPYYVKTEITITD